MYALHTVSSFLVLFMLLLNTAAVSVVHADSLPAASTVSLVDVAQVAEGMVVVAVESTEAYTTSTVIDDPQVYGTIAALPPVVFATGENETPVITEGIAFVQVSDEGGEIKRGDLLVSSSQPGVAMRAGETHQNVFAIALESLEGNVGVIQAEVGAQRAQLLRSQQRELAAASVAKEEVIDPQKFSFIRGAVALVLVVGALGFLLYSFRLLLTHGVVSVGRNPRARGSIMTFSLANILFALILCAVVVFIAVAILVLPL